MMIRAKTHEEKRLSAIKLRFHLLPKTCRCCKDKAFAEKMWHVDMWGCNRTVHRHYYCVHCFKNREEVLKEVTAWDEEGMPPYGIAFVDPF